MNILQRTTPLVAVALLLIGCGGDDETVWPPGEFHIDAVSKGWRPPMVDADAVTALRKQAASEGRALVVDCWATWCGSCVAMFPHLHQAVKERGEDVLLVSLSFDEGEDLSKQAAGFLNEHKAMENAYRAAEGSDAKDAVAKALSPNWDGGALPAVFVYAPDGGIALEFTQTRGQVQDWVDEITAAVDRALSE